ncbi:unnamed protein product [Cochlearia groenlandica]
MKQRDEERCEDYCIHLDLVVEILKKVPTKSLVKFRSVSKQWSCIIGSRKDLIDSIITRSLAQPLHKLPLFIFHHSLRRSFFTVSHVYSQSTKHAVSLTPRILHNSFEWFDYQYVRGLICCSSEFSHLVVIYNPTTMQCFTLPAIKSSPVNTSRKSYCYFGYDPVMNQYKALDIIVDRKQRTQTCYVFTLGQGKSWREIQSIEDKLFQRIKFVCIDGTIYFGVDSVTQQHQVLLMSFNVRYERFDYVWAPETMLRTMLNPIPYERQTLVNHLGKLGCICFSGKDTYIWIMDNAEKQEWSKVIFCLPIFPLGILGFGVHKFTGVTPTGEFFVTLLELDESFYVYYYDMKRNSFRRLQVQGTTPDQFKHPSCPVYVFAIHDHVENTMWL